ncbi:MAG: type II toxin-antitoxin system HicB family antitoxin [Armatimonadetes bacterium]|nr:type II toxin-antitoxin system HicB family antitoxin [Armatimonadota bacterium]
METKLTILYLPAEEGGFTASIVEVPGAISEGDTIEEAREMVLDALNELTLARRELAATAVQQGATVEYVSAVGFS